MRFRPHLMMVAAVITYLALVSLTLMRVEILYYAWPYPLMLALQKWVTAGSRISSIGGWLCGLGLVLLWVAIVRQVVERAGRRGKLVLVGILISSLAAWLVPLLVEFPSDVVYGLTAMIQVLGLGSITYLVYAVASRRWAEARALGLLATSVGLTSWYVPLLALQVAAWRIASAAGWPVGE